MLSTAHRDQGVMVLRPVFFHSHEVKYVFYLDREAVLTPTPSPTFYTCWRVPHHLQEKDWSELISTQASKQLQEQLVLVDICKIMQVLSKMESQDYIHTYLTIPAGGGVTRPGDAMLFELARYGLEFELQEGQLVSRDYQGYRLRLQQQLFGMVGNRFKGPASMTAVAAADRGGGDGDNAYACAQSTSSFANGASVSTGNSRVGSSNGNRSSLSTTTAYDGSSSLETLGSELAARERMMQSSEQDYTLPEFSQYLLLQRMEGSGVVLGAAKADTLVLVPATETGVQRSKDGQVTMVLPEGSGAKLKVKGWSLPGMTKSYIHCINLKSNLFVYGWA
jgi:hypothetical protein